MSVLALAVALLTAPALASDEVPEASPRTTKALLQTLEDEMASDEVAVVIDGEGTYLAFQAELGFDTNSARLTADTRRAIDAIAGTLREHPTLKVQTEGHADERLIEGGPYADNQALSLARATAVHDALVAAGIDDARVQPIAAAAREPEAANAPIALDLNRRVVVRIVPGLDPEVIDLGMTPAAPVVPGQPSFGDDGIATLW